MGYTTLILALAILCVLAWVIVKNARRSGFVHAVFRFDTIVGIIACVYIIVTSIRSLILAS